MEKNNHSLKSLISGGGGFMLLFLLCFMAAQTLSAQVTLTWTGLTDSDATNQDNWDPQQPPDGNDLYIDSAYKYTNLPVFGGPDSIFVNSLTLEATGEMTINFDDSLTVLDAQATEYFTPHGTINIEEGTLVGKRFHIEDTMTVINVYSGGILQATKYFFMGGYSSSAPTAGYLNLTGTALVHYEGEGFGRFPSDTTTGIITITPPARMELQGNNLTEVEYRIGTGQIRGSEGFNAIASYDPESGFTTVEAQDATIFLIEPETPIVVNEDEPGPLVSVVQNQGYEAMSGFDWQYSTTSGSGYVSFSPAVTEDHIEPVFPDPGIYYLVCEGTLTEGGTKISNEVQVFVGSTMVLVDPDGDQFLKPGLNGATLTVTKDASITGVEWKWSNTLGSGYASFDTPQTGDELTPNFADEGIYYIVCEGTDGSETFMSKDVKITVDQVTYSITWNGSASNSADEAINWDPISSPDLNVINVGARDTYVDSLVFNGAGNQTISKIFQADDATMTVDKGNDTLHVSSNSYGIRNLFVESGMLNYKDLRLEVGTINVNGGEFLVRESYFMMGNKNGTTGGYVNITGDGVFRVRGEQPGRFSPDTTLSRIYITDDGLLDVIGDWRAGAEPLLATLQLYTDADREIVMEYDETNDVTLISSQPLLVFGIAPGDNQVVEAGEDIATLETVNDDAVVSYEWKYSDSQGGPYVAFDPAQTENTLTVSFDALGDYYIVCEGATEGDPVVSNEVLVQVVSVTIAPTDEQQIYTAEEGTPLTVTETVEPDFRDWKKTTTSGSGYTSVVPAEDGTTYTPLFITEGTYYVVCASTYGDKTIFSNEVTIVVSEENAIDETVGGLISVYPNPARNMFMIDAGTHSHFTLTVTSITGKVVLTEEFDNVTGPREISLEGQHGVYFVRIKADDETRVTKLILE
jgi:hypothetical protein